jgi:hypothetical protein
MVSTVAVGERAGEAVPGNAENPAVVRRQGAVRAGQAAELLAELDEEEDGFASDDEDVVLDEDDVVDDEPDGLDAGLLLDVEPRESLR